MITHREHTRVGLREKQLEQEKQETLRFINEVLENNLSFQLQRQVKAEQY